MKRRGILLAAAVALTLAACGTEDKTTDRSDPSLSQKQETPADSESESKQETPLDSQKYVSSDGSYEVTLLQGLAQTDMQLSPGSAMMGLDGGADRSGFSAVALGSPQSGVPGHSGSIESLEEYADHITGMILDGSGVTVDWKETEAPSTEGALQCLAWEGVAKSGSGRGQAYGYYVQTEGSFYSVVIVGNSGDVEEARQVLALSILEGTSAQAGAVDFINSMTAVLDSVNGANLRETYKMLEDSGADESQLEELASQARQSLSASWGVENTADLMETADWLMNEGHNADAFKMLEEYGGTDETDRDAFDARLKEQNLDEGTRISLLAAYDAYSAYGDGAIAAWDLSRVGTVMGFGYTSGYCTYEEAMDKLLEAAEKSQKLFGSWEDFNQSYLYGYIYWSEESVLDAGSSAAERAGLIDSMQSQANGPFSVDWNMDLKKEW